MKCTAMLFCKSYLSTVPNGILKCSTVGTWQQEFIWNLGLNLWINLSWKRVNQTKMGNSISCFIANIYMSKLEIFAEETQQYFLDYGHVMWMIFFLSSTKSTKYCFHFKHLLHYPTIKLTHETENQNRLHRFFLDLTLVIA